MNNFKNIKLVILDVDGTLTDGKIYYDNQGNEMKAFNVKDGMAIAQAIHSGIEFAIITGRKSSIVEKRAQELGIKYLYQGVHHKVKVADEIIRKLDITYNDVMYIGDDINDLEIMSRVAWSGCPKDATYEVLECANIIANSRAGDGAVRDIIEIVLKDQGKWLNIVKNYRGIVQ